VVATCAADGSPTELLVVPGDDPLPLLHRFRPLVLDVPIGLLDRGPRLVDTEARLRLGRRASSVFPAPLRPMLGAATWEEACRIGERAGGRRCSRQTAGILPRIRAVDRRLTPALQEEGVVEGHPEVVFAAMAELRGLPHPKRLPAGREERLALLRIRFPDVDERLAAIPLGLRGDAVDACALLWTALRVLRGEATRLPAGTVERDPRGLRCEMVT
jgi:predicted RNase H-like nuclease